MVNNVKPLKREDFTVEKFLRIWADLNNNPIVDMTIDNVCLTVPPTKADLTSSEAKNRLHELIQEFKQKPHYIESINNGSDALIGIDSSLNSNTATQHGLTLCPYSELPVYADVNFYQKNQLELDFLVTGSLWMGATLNCGDEFLKDLSPGNWLLEQWWTQGTITGNLQEIHDDLQRYA